MLAINIMILYFHLDLGYLQTPPGTKTINEITQRSHGSFSTMRLTIDLHVYLCNESVRETLFSTRK